MRIDWTEYLNQTINVTMSENYGMTMDPKAETPVYEIVFKTGRLAAAFDDGLMLEADRDGQLVKIYIPYLSIKCVEIFDI
jgi:hypothetical protein